jgi:predicted metal-dependent HD superfamily phosphohydrolase
MNTINKEIIAEAEIYASELIKQNKNTKNLFYHTIKHTQNVVEAVKKIGLGEGLDENSIQLLTYCAWFHDVGYSSDCANHEEVGVKMAIGFLKEKNIDPKQLDTIKNCIMSTRWPQAPKDHLSKVLCDADMVHLAEPNYPETAEQLRQELIHLKDQNIKKLQFHVMNSVFFNHHSYFTDYGRKTFEEGKQKNLLFLNEKVDKLINKKSEKAIVDLTKENQKLKQKAEKSKGYSRGVESMFRLTARNQISLSAIADNKSNILITVNSIIISVGLSVLVSRFDESPKLIIPTLIFLAFSLTTIIFSILSTRPNISKGKFTKEDIKENKVNLLFFGNFYNMKYEEYDWAIQELMTNDDNLYSTMTKDQYFLGKVLAKKYKLLRISYNVFMFGIIISVIAFILAHINI